MMTLEIGLVCFILKRRRLFAKVTNSISEPLGIFGNGCIAHVNRCLCRPLRRLFLSTFSACCQLLFLASRPVGEPTLDNFRSEKLPIPHAGPGQMLLRTLWLSLDPYMRGRMSDAPSYAKPVGIGDVMEGGTVSEVVASNVPRFAKGDIVVGRTGWQTHALSDGSGLQKVDPTRAPIQTALGVLGMPGMTAYMGLLEIGKPAAGETVVVAAASGAVGSVVGQIARIKGAYAVGIAGGPEKCRYVTEELGFDACIDHRTSDFDGRLAAACPKGIDVYFENVGGAVFEAVFPLLNPFARIPVCGLISMYNATLLSAGPILLPHLMRAILTKRLTFRGSSSPTFLRVIGISCAMFRPGSARDGSNIAKTWLRDSRTLHRLSLASCGGRISASSWCALRAKSPVISP
jgi:NADPH-dependent curcumin reductase CurA